MPDPFVYDFGYSWSVTNGHIVPLTLFGALGAVSVWRRWPAWLGAVCGLVAVWACAGLVITHGLFRLNTPLPLMTARFLASGTGRVLDAGAGSGRAAIGLLLERPQATVTALDIYSGYYGIDDNTPERLLANARIAGVADRVDVRTGDVRRMPFGNGEFDGVISVAAIDHLREGIPIALDEAARVLKPGGQFLLVIVNVDLWARVASPHALGHHRPVDAAWWRARLGEAGFDVVEQGRKPASLYFLSTRHS